MFRFLWKTHRNNGLFSVNTAAQMLHMLKPCRHRSTILEQSQVELFVRLLDVNPKVAEKILKDGHLRALPFQHLASRFTICKKYGIPKEDIIEYPHILRFLPSVLENRILFLQESGLSHVTGNMVTCFFPIMRKSVSLFKAHFNLPREHNVAESFLSQLHQPPPEVPPMQHTDDNITLYDLHVNCLCYYLKWKFELSEREVQVMYKSWKRLRYRSFRLLKETMDLLEKDIGFNIEKLQTNTYLLCTNPENTRRILNEIKDIGGLDLRTTLLKHPKILSSNVESIHSTLKHLRDFCITDNAIRRCPEIFTLSSKTVLQRLKDLRKIPEFNALYNHTRILKLAMNLNRAQARLQYMHDHRIKCSSLHVLTAPRWLFERFVVEGVDRTKGKDLCGLLGAKLAKSSTLVHAELMKHPFWLQVSLVDVKNTLDFLMKEYRTEDIFKNVQIVFYPREKVERTLQSIHQMDLNEFEYIITPSQQLALCLYFMELDHHFTGNGIWLLEQKNPIETSVATINTRIEHLPKVTARTEVSATL